MISYSRSILPPIALIILLAGCGGDLSAPAFDGNRAFGYLEKQVSFGPRVPGSAASAQCRDYFYDFFSERCDAVDSQAFDYFDYYSESTVRMVNVLACFEGLDRKGPAILFLAHYDSRPRAEHAFDTTLAEQPIDGANDGASGVAVLMELANLYKESRPPVNIDLLLVDGEDWGKPGDNDAYLLGSREFARQNVHGKYRFAIVVDLIGDKNQEIYREIYSEKFRKELNDMVWSTAAELQINTFIDSVRYGVIDDHLSLNTGGIPAIVLIDFDYEFWHTEFDTPDKCSPESLTNVGRILAEISYRKSLWPKI